jgi:hypothetical protein
MLPNSWDAPRRGGLVRAWLVVVAVGGVVGMSAFFGVGPRSGAEPAPIAKPKPIDIEEIEELITRLGHADRAIRGHAYEILLGVGHPVLERYPFAKLDTKPNAVPLAFKLYRAIQKKHGIATVRYHGLEFTPAGPVDWRFPKAQGQTKLETGVQIVNKTDEQVRFPDYYVQVHFKRADFTDVSKGGGWEGCIEFVQPGILIDAGKKGVTSGVAGELVREDEAGCCTFRVKPNLNSWFFYKGLKPGGYFVRYDFSNNHNPFIDIKPPFWAGRVDTGWVAIEIE